MRRIIPSLLVVFLLLTACRNAPNTATGEASSVQPKETRLPFAVPTDIIPTSELPTETEAPIEIPVSPATEAPAWTRADEPAAAPQPTPNATETPKLPSTDQLCVLIDPGHQSKANLGKEALGPGSLETKYKTSGGTWGKSSGAPEYELNLEISLLLRDELAQRGYCVVLTRETNDVDLSNIERAAMAEQVGADAFLRIHANGADDPSVSGAVAICMTPSSPYHPELYKESRALSDCVINAYCEATGAKNNGVWETDSMSGVNWSTVPVTILEMGYMTNPEEDLRMASPAYREKMVNGIANGIDHYFGKAPAKTSVPENKKPSTPMQRLEAAVDAELSRLDSCWDVWIENCADGTHAHCTRNILPDAHMVSASLIKLFIMGAVYDRIQAGAISEESVAADLGYMITISDNGSANSLTKLLGGGDASAGMAAVNEWAASMGYTNVAFNRLMLDNNGLQNYVTAESCAAILRDIYQGKCVSEDASVKMLKLLKGQQVNDRIPAGLPSGTVSAHKTGNLAGLCVADVGIVFSDGGDFILCVICNKPITDIGATNEIVRIAEMAFNSFHTKS